MIFHPLDLPGAFVIEPQRLADERGFFARVFCRETFEARGLHGDFGQCNISYNGRKGTLRGMHFQAAPLEEVKTVRCTSGAIFDVFVDLRPDSPTYRRWHGLELSAENRRIAYIPAGFAHGFQTLCDGAEVFYQMGQSFSAPHARGVRYDDPAFGICWPLPVSVISDKDAGYPDWQP